MRSIRLSRFVLLFLLGAAPGCHAQSASPDRSPSPDLDRQIELTLRSQYNVPPDYKVSLGQRTRSDVSGYDTLPVTFSSASGQQKTTQFLISKDNKKIARLDVFPLADNPAVKISTAGRPVRGNPEAKVTILSFDDLECPFCARINAELFPATILQYANFVRYVYLDFPAPQHPWAMHAAIDVNCMAAQNQPAYWTLVDYIHSHTAEIDGDRTSAGKSDTRLDELTRQEGQQAKVDVPRLNACVAKQDKSAIRSSLKEGESLGVDQTPILFINGERVIGAVPQSVLWTIIDHAIRSAGGVPPPRQDNTPASQ